MRIWDISPGYLNRQSLLGEHRELHGMVSIFVNNKKGYSNHPETKRWVNCEKALFLRHLQLKFEMNLRGYNEKTPLDGDFLNIKWPENYIDEPFKQFEILAIKYENKEKGRISFPKNIYEIWAHHKYSVLARNQVLYKEIGKKVANKEFDFKELAKILTEILRERPEVGGIRNAIQHMWGYVSQSEKLEKINVEKIDLKNLLIEVQRRVINLKIKYLTESTALNELMVWI